MPFSDYLPDENGCNRSCPAGHAPLCFLIVKSPVLGPDGLAVGETLVCVIAGEAGGLLEAGGGAASKRRPGPRLARAFGHQLEVC